MADNLLLDAICGGLFRKQLSLASTFHDNMPIRGFIHSFTHSQKTMVLENNSFILGAKSSCNSSTLLTPENNPTKRHHSMLVIKDTSLYHQFLSQNTLP